MNALDLLGTIAGDALWSGVAALGFAVLFNVPRRALLGCILCGALGHACRALLLQSGLLSIEAASLAGATAVGFAGEWFARRGGMPDAVFTISGVIPMVPGVYAYQTMIGLLEVVSLDPTSAALQTALAGMAVNGVRTFLILGALAAGIAAPTLIFHRRAPVV